MQKWGGVYVIKLRRIMTNASTGSANVPLFEAFPEPAEGFQALNLITWGCPFKYLPVHSSYDSDGTPAKFKTLADY